MAKKQIKIMCTAFRDGFQSVYGARVFSKDFMPAVNMEELNKIIERVKDSVAKNVSMEEDAESRAIELRDKCVDNYNRIIKEHFDMLHTLASDLCNKYGIFYTVRDDNKSEHLLIKYYGNNRCGFYVEVKADRYLYKPYYWCNNQAIKEDICSIHACNDRERVIAFSELFSTEDKANAFLAEVNEQYAKLFEEVVRVVDEKNATLALQLDSLREALSTSSVVKEEEDGSIEIHLNGKTYKGTLVEE